ncbi:MAG: hypothetical protein HFI08_03485 [Bacilli bacterium]|jgi:putative Mn2+ efflux pump MntP|nr:hypothetical protein [Bacilli bacterium]
MIELVTIFTIAVALSMDTFSLSLGLGTCNLSNKKSLALSSIVGVMHFIMPCLGILIGKNLQNFFKINSNFLLGIILILIAGQMLYEIFVKEEETIDFSLTGMLFFAIGVSIDAFSTGLGLTAITNNLFLAMLIFSITSFFFTLLGLFIGKYANKILGVYASFFGALLLILIGLSHLLK